MSSETAICNLALSHLGQSDEINNIITEKSAAAQACRRFYDVARDATLGDFSWPFATKYEALNLVATTPTIEWGYSYRKPVDCLFARRIVSGFRNETAQTRIAYKMGRDASGGLIYTDQADAVLEYTMRITDVSKFTAQFILALSFRLALYIVPRINNGDPFKQQSTLANLYNFEITSAQSAVFNEEQRDQAPESIMISVRR